MTIHYNGSISKRPNLLACRTRTPQDVAQTWQGTDCGACKMSLMGAPVAQADDVTKTGFVSDFDAVTVTISTPAADSDSEPDAQRVTWDAFDHRWAMG